MGENLMTNDHKATNDKFRRGYDEVKWNTPKPQVPHNAFHDWWGCVCGYAMPYVLRNCERCGRVKPK